MTISTNNPTNGVNTTAAASTASSSSSSSHNNGMNQMSCGQAAEIFDKLDALIALYKKLMKANNDLTINQLQYQSSAIDHTAAFQRQAAESQGKAIVSRAFVAFASGGLTAASAGATRGMTNKTSNDMSKKGEELGRLETLHTRAQNLPATPNNVVVGNAPPPPPPLPAERQARIAELERGNWSETRHTGATTDAAIRKLTADNKHGPVFERLQKDIASKHTEINTLSNAKSNTTQLCNMSKEVISSAATGGIQTGAEAKHTTDAGKADADKSVAQSIQGINSAAAAATSQAEGKVYDETGNTINTLKQAVDKVYQG